MLYYKLELQGIKTRTDSFRKEEYNMATKKSTKSYYQRNKKYREKLIAENTAKHKANRPKYAKEQREYYADSEKYRKYKRAYAKRYRKEEPIKSKARKDRKAYK